MSREMANSYTVRFRFFKTCKQLQFTVTFDIPCAPPPPLSKRNAIKDGFFSLEEIFIFVAKYNVHEIRVRWLLYDVEWNRMIYHSNVSSLFNKHNLRMQKMIDNFIRMKCWIHLHTCTRSRRADPASN